MTKRRTQKQIRWIKRAMLVWGVLGALGLLWVLGSFISLAAGLLGRIVVEEPTEEMHLASIQEAIWKLEETAESASGAKEEERQWELVRKCMEIYEADAELLVLVNWENELQDLIYKEKLRSICNGRLQASEYLYEDLVSLLAAAKADGYEYWIASGYRSRQRQQALVDEDVAYYQSQGMSYEEALHQTYLQTMPAGKSEHETGLALDILYGENPQMDLSQADTAGNRWLAESAHKYGFILRYPEDAEEITGIDYEPWHYRYVGKDAAEFLYQNKLTLEEFHDLLDLQG